MVNGQNMKSEKNHLSQASRISNCLLSPLFDHENTLFCGLRVQIFSKKMEFIRFWFLETGIRRLWSGVFFISPSHHLQTLASTILPQKNTIRYFEKIKSNIRKPLNSHYQGSKKKGSFQAFRCTKIKWASHYFLIFSSEALYTKIFDIFSALSPQK